MLGFLQGPIAPQANLDVILRKRLEIIGTAMRTRGLEERAQLVAEFRANVLPLFGPHALSDEPMHSLSHPDRIGALLHPIVHAVYPMTDVAAAHGAMERNEGIGKIVLSW
jgi:NADPH:quinone reductase-like Zn-dependent oxidoreductase